MKTLLIDAGNTRLKWATLDDAKLSQQSAIDYHDKTPVECFASLLNSFNKQPLAVVLVSVLGQTFIDNANAIASQNNHSFHAVKSVPKLGAWSNGYDAPEQLGADRFVAMIAAYSLYNEQENKPKQNLIVIDCGTAITIDAIKADGQHLGGLILPSQTLCTNSLVTQTKQLEINAHSSTNHDIKLLAKNTQEAILAGSYYGLSGAIKSICTKLEDDMQKSDKNHKTLMIICGGGAESFLSQLGTKYLHQADLVMHGLKRIADIDLE